MYYPSWWDNSDFLTIQEMDWESWFHIARTNGYHSLSTIIKITTLNKMNTNLTLGVQKCKTSYDDILFTTCTLAYQARPRSLFSNTLIRDENGTNFFWSLNWSDFEFSSISRRNSAEGRVTHYSDEFNATIFFVNQIEHFSPT